MKGQDLCSSCIKSKDCVLSGNSPVWECEEHSFGESRVVKAQYKAKKHNLTSVAQESEVSE